MSFSIREIICRLVAPWHELSVSWLTWGRLLRELRTRGLNGKRESGAFLLGSRRKTRARVVDFILYDDLDPRCLDSGIVHFDGRYFGALWDICKERGLVVVADVHTHPGGPGQSDSDRAHPMIAAAGHIALIIPRFATVQPARRELGIYRYQGSSRWKAVPPRRRRRFLHIGL